MSERSLELIADFREGIELVTSIDPHSENRREISMSLSNGFMVTYLRVGRERQISFGSARDTKLSISSLAPSDQYLLRNVEFVDEQNFVDTRRMVNYIDQEDQLNDTKELVVRPLLACARGLFGVFSTLNQDEATIKQRWDEEKKQAINEHMEAKRRRLEFDRNTSAYTTKRWGPEHDLFAHSRAKPFDARDRYQR